MTTGAPSTASVRRGRISPLSSDFIAGFPGETDEDFAATLAIAGEIGFAQSFSFKYSPRPGTPGAAMEPQVPEEVKAERLAALQTLLTASQRAFNAREIGRVLPVLLEKAGRHPGQMGGRSPYLQAVFIENAAAHAQIGDVVLAEITDASTQSLAGRLLEHRVAAE